MDALLAGESTFLKDIAEPLSIAQPPANPADPLAEEPVSDSKAKKKARPPPPWANPTTPTKVPRNTKTSDAADAGPEPPSRYVQQDPGHSTSSSSWGVPDDGSTMPWSENTREWEQHGEDLYWEASNVETDLAKSLNIPWRLRGPPGPTVEGERFRGQRWRENSERWANRGGHRRDRFKCYYTALSRGSSKLEAQDLADYSFPDQKK